MYSSSSENVFPLGFRFTFSTTVPRGELPKFDQHSHSPKAIIDAYMRSSDLTTVLIIVHFRDGLACDDVIVRPLVSDGSIVSAASA